MHASIKTGISSAIAALAVASCCVLPMALMLFGLGGSWIAVFGRIAAFSYIVLCLAGVALLAGWVVALRRKLPAGQLSMLGAATLLSAIAWVTVLYESQINDQLISLM